MRGDGGLRQGRSSRIAEKWFGSGYDFQGVLKGSADI